MSVSSRLRTHVGPSGQQVFEVIECHGGHEGDNKQCHESDDGHAGSRHRQAPREDDARHADEGHEEKRKTPNPEWYWVNVKGIREVVVEHVGARPKAWKLDYGAASLS